jgi:hypothetical protein
MRTPPRILILIVVAATSWMAAGVSGQSPQLQGGGTEEVLQRRAERVGEFLRRLDTNRNGMIDADEVSDGQKALLKRMLSSSGEVKYPLDINQALEAHMKSYRALVTPSDSGGAGGANTPTKAASPPTVPAGAKPASNSAGSAVAPFSPRSETAPAASRAATASVSGPAPANVTKSQSTSPRKAIRFLTPHERLPKELPDWFKTRDADGDGQISMAEFAADWTPAKVAEFLRLDLNNDGIITPDEFLKDEKNAGSHK